MGCVMRPGKWFFTVCMIAVLLLTSAGSTAQATCKIYGYVSYGGVPAGGATVTLAGPDSGQATTAENGYYEFVVTPGNYIVTAAYSGHSASRTYVVNGAEVRIDIDISTATPTPTPTPTPTVTPTPSHDPGGMVIRNESSSFIPMAPEFTVTPVPRPSSTPTPTPTIAPTPTPTPTPVHGLLSNLYIWLVIAMIAILIIAAAALIYLRK
ncbi:carboxypeptidase-like regulatory domain-containing protein [Methanocella paludicola]|nr:carboxypeptidase-like regulatory domain-containing protein [Methanocella paludicola]